MDGLLRVKVSRDLLDIKYKRTGLFVLYPFIALLIFVFIFLNFGKKEISIKSSGMVASENLGVVLSSPVSTKVTEIKLLNNTDVKKGQEIIVFDFSHVEQEMEKIREDIKETEIKLEYLEIFRDSVFEETNKLTDNLYGYKSKVDNYLVSLEINNFDSSEYKKKSLEGQKEIVNSQLETIENKLMDYLVLRKYVESNAEVSTKFSSDAISLEAKDFKNNLDSIDSDLELQNLKIETLLSLENSIEMLEQEKLILEEKNLLLEENINNLLVEADYQLLSSEELKTQLISDIEVSKSETQLNKQEFMNQLEIYENEKKRYVLLAKDDGKIEFSETFLIGSVIPEGTEIGKIIKSDQDKYIEAYISSDQIFGVKEGQEVRFTVNNLENNKNETITGVIQDIQIEPMKTEQGNYYKIYCAFEDDIVFSYGTIGDVYILTGKTTYFNFLWKRIFK